MNLNNEKKLHNYDYVNSLSLSPFIFNKRFWTDFQNHFDTNNFIKKKEKQEKVIMKLLNYELFHNRNYVTFFHYLNSFKPPPI